MPPGVLGVLMMPKRNDRPLFILIIILLFALAALCGVSGSSLGREAAPDTEYTERTAAPSLEGRLVLPGAGNAEASVRLEAFDLGRSPATAPGNSGWTSKYIIKRRSNTNTRSV